MKRWNLLDQATTPDGSVMALYEHDGDYVIRVDGAELMSTRRFASEVALAEAACVHLAKKRGARVLIGGLGMGFTLRAALAQLPADARVVVAELMPAVVAWNRNPDYKLGCDAVADPRTQVEVRDVAELIAAGRAGFDAIMLDVDNGARAMTTAGNRRLYETAGLERVRAALRPGGVAVYWSADDDPLFAEEMRRVGFAVDTQRVRAHSTSGGRHVLFVGRVR